MRTVLLAVLFISAALGAAYAVKPVGAPESTPAERNFFVGSIDHHGISCCSEADGYREGLTYEELLNAAYPHPGGIILRAWMPDKDTPGGYRINVAGQWVTVGPELVIKSPPNPPNITGGAVVWATFTFLSTQTSDPESFKMTNQIDTISVRCFSPGNEF